MINNSVDQEWYEKLLWFLTLLFPALMTVKHGVSVVFYLMGLVSMYIVIKKRPRLNLLSNYLLAGFLLLFVVSLVSLFNADDMVNGIRRLKKIQHFFPIIPILPAMAMVRKNLVLPYLIGSCIGGLVVLSITVYQIHFLGHTRAIGFYNIIMVGSMAVILALSVFIGLFFVKNNKGFFYLLLLSLASALYAAILSGTRGAWLGFLGGVPLGIFLMRKAFPKKKFIYASLIAILIFVSAGIIGNDMIIQRWETTLHYMKVRQTEESKTTAIGIRFSLWEAALRMWSRNPVLGTGLGDYEHDLVKMVTNGEIEPPDINNTAIAYAHNIFLESLACTGILGILVMTFATIVMPLLFFFKAIKSSNIDFHLYAAVFGVVFIIAFCIFGLTENWLAHKQLVMTYSLLLAIMGSRFALKTD